MNKQEFVEAVAERADLSKADASRVLEAMLEGVTEVLKKRDDVSFTGFGRFATAKRKARQGVNPQNPGEKLRIPAAVVPKFKPGKALKSAVAGAENQPAKKAEREAPGGGAEDERREAVGSGAASQPSEEPDWTPLSERT